MNIQALPLVVLILFASCTSEAPPEGSLGVSCEEDDMTRTESLLVGPDATSGGKDPVDGLRMYLDRSEGLGGVRAEDFSPIAKSKNEVHLALEENGVTVAVARVITSNSYWVVEEFAACESIGSG